MNNYDESLEDDPKLNSEDKKFIDHKFKMEPEEPIKIYKFPVYEQQAAAGLGRTGRDGKFTMENIFTDDISQNAVLECTLKELV